MRESKITCDRCCASITYTVLRPDDWTRRMTVDFCPVCDGALDDFVDGSALMTEKDRLKKGTYVVKPS